jgi:hypothetical protein
MRRNQIFWGAIILLAGVLLLLNTMGILTLNVWRLFWPAVIILLGVWFLLGPVLFKPNTEEKQVNIPLEGASEAEIKIGHGAGRMTIHAISGIDLLAGNFTGGVDTTVRRDGILTRVKLNAPEMVFFPFPPMLFHRGFEWNFGINRDIPVSLHISSGASETEMDLSEMKVRELKVDTGASKTVMTLPAQAGYTKVKVSSGAAEVRIRVPEGVAATIKVDSGLSGININTTRFPHVGNVYQSSDYATAANKAEIKIDSGVGSVEIQ